MILNDNNPSDKRKYPSRWPMMKGKRLFFSVDVRSETGKEELLTVSHITGITPRKMKNVTMFQAESLVGYKRCEVNDIAANTMWMWQGAIGVSKYKGVISPSYNVYRQKGNYYNSQYLDYLLREPTLVDVYHSLSTGIRPSRLRLYPEQLFSIDFPVPCIEEQEKMVKYIKWHLSKINSLIYNLRSQIELIKEEKAIVLYNALTRGVGTAHKIVECEEPCIGTIPSDWVLSKLKYQCRMYSGDSISDGDKDSYTTKTEIPYISTKDVDLRLCTVDYENGLYIPNDSQFKIAPSGSVLLCIEGGSAGKKKALLERDVAFVNKLCAFVATSINQKYLFYYLCSDVFMLQFKKQMTGLIGGVSISAIKRLLIPVPSENEQKDIVRFLDDKCQKLDEAINEIEKRIALLIELRSKLISDVVTGQIDVREIEISEFEYVEDMTYSYDEDDEERDDMSKDEEV